MKLSKLVLIASLTLVTSVNAATDYNSSRSNKNSNHAKAKDPTNKNGEDLVLRKRPGRTKLSNGKDNDCDGAKKKKFKAGSSLSACVKSKKQKKSDIKIEGIQGESKDR